MGAAPGRQISAPDPAWATCRGEQRDSAGCPRRGTPGVFEGLVGVWGQAVGHLHNQAKQQTSQPASCDSFLSQNADFDSNNWYSQFRPLNNIRFLPISDMQKCSNLFCQIVNALQSLIYVYIFVPPNGTIVCRVVSLKTIFLKQNDWTVISEEIVSGRCLPLIWNTLFTVTEDVRISSTTYASQR